MINYPFGTVQEEVILIFSKKDLAWVFGKHFKYKGGKPQERAT